MKPPFMLICALLALLLVLICGPLPLDPESNPEYAEIEILSVNGDSALTPPVQAIAGKNVVIRYHLIRSHFIDSVTSEILNGSVIEEKKTVKAPWIDSTAEVTLSFPTSGTRTLKYTAFVNNGFQKTELQDFNVLPADMNSAPVWSAEKIDKFSFAGIPASRDLAPYVSDADNDKLLFEYKTASSAGFSFDKTKITSSEALSEGNYFITIIASDGTLSDTTEVSWKVLPQPIGEATVVDDAVTCVMGIPVAIDVLANDQVPAGSVISEITEPEHGNAKVDNKKIVYTSTPGFVGKDSLSYTVNDKKTGWIRIVVTSESSSNHPPLWAPETTDVFAPKGVSTTGNVLYSVTDADMDDLSFTIEPPSGGWFTADNSLITSSAEIPVGTYLIKVAASDGNVVTKGVIRWIVFEESQVAAIVKSDLVSAGDSERTSIKPLENDSVTTGTGTLFISYVAQGKHGKAVIQNGTIIVYTPEAGFSGNDTVLYIVNGKDTGSVCITVSLPVVENTAPAWTAQRYERASVKGDREEFDLSRFVSDRENDLLTFTCALTPGFTCSGAGMLVADGAHAIGKYSVRVTVSDGKLASDATVEWEIIAPSAVVVEPRPDKKTTQAGTAVSIPVLANDLIVSGEGTLVVTSLCEPAHGTASVNNDEVVYQPKEGYWGADQFCYVINGKDTGMVEITISKPGVTVKDDLLAVPENGSSKINVLANDAISSGKLSISKLLDGVKGVASFKDSVVEYTPKPDVSGVDTVKYILATDDTGRVIVTIRAMVITAVNDAVSLSQGEERTARVLDNDQNSDGTLKITAISNAKLGTASFTDSTIVYKADASSEGEDVITYTLNGGRASAQLTVTVLKIKVTAVKDEVTLTEDGAATTVDVLNNDAISNNSALTITKTSLPKLGAVAITGNKLVYTPSQDSSGTDYVEYEINGIKLCSLVVTITPVPDLPLFTYADTVLSLKEGEKDTLELRASDADKTPVRLSLVGNPAWAAAAEVNDVIKIPLAPGFAVSSSTVNTVATFTVRGISGTDTINKTVAVTVLNVNSAPVFTSPLATVAIDEGAGKTVGFKATDAQGDALTYAVVTTPLPAWISPTVSPDSIKLVLSPAFDVVASGVATATFDIVVSVSDGGSAAVTHTVKVTVTNIGSAPVFTAPAAAIAVNEGQSKTAVFKATDPQGDAVTFSVSGAPGWIVVTKTDSIKLVLSPGFTVATAAAPVTSINVILSATAGGETTNHSVNITVANVPQNPTFTAFPPATLHSRQGDSLVTTAFAGNDPEGGTVSFSLVSPPSGMTINASDNKIHWLMPRTSYLVNDQIPVTVMASNSSGGQTERVFTVIVDPHKWLLINPGFTVPQTSFFTAVGKDTVFRVELSATEPSEQISSVYRSIDAGKTWPSVPFFTFGGTYQGPNSIAAKGSDVYVFNDVRHGGYYITFPWNNPTYTQTSTSILLASDVSPDGNRLIVNDVEFTVFLPLVSYTDKSVNYSNERLFDSLVSISAGNTYIWAVDHSAGTHYLGSYISSATDTLHGFKAHSWYDNANKVWCDNNNGDTAFVINGTTSKIGQKIVPSSQAVISVPAVPTELTMLSGYLGWFLGADGKVYFTNSAFRNTSAEVLLDENGLEVSIVKMFKSSNGVSVFAYAKDAAGVIKLFRY